MPDYDHRADRPDDAIDALLWVPRILTGPLYLLTELIREPLGLVDTWVEQNDVPRLLFDFFRFGPEKNIAILPTVFYEFGFLPSVGAYAYWNDMGVRGHRLSFHGATWGLDWLSFSLHDTVRVDSHLSFITRAHYVERPDFLLGIEDAANGHNAQTRYASEHMDVELGYELRITRRSMLAFSGLVGRSSFGNTTFDAPNRPSVISYVGAHGGPLPIGFASGYGLVSARAQAIFDTRDPSGIPSAGIRLEARAEVAGTFDGVPGAHWLRLDGEALAASDLGSRRVLSIAVDAAAILPFDGSPLPFDQTIDLGGSGPMPAFLPGELRGTSALVATFAYDWPIWVFINARIYAAVGGPFGDRFEQLTLDRMRLNLGIAVRPNDPGDHPFEVGFGVGSEPLGGGVTFDTVRFFVGARNLL